MVETHAMDRRAASKRSARLQGGAALAWTGGLAVVRLFRHHCGVVTRSSSRGQVVGAAADRYGERSRQGGHRTYQPGIERFSHPASPSGVLPTHAPLDLTWIQ